MLSVERGRADLLDGLLVLLLEVDLVLLPHLVQVDGRHDADAGAGAGRGRDDDCIPHVVGAEAVLLVESSAFAHGRGPGRRRWRQPHP